MAVGAVAPMLTRERSLSFWAAAIGLLAAALHELPRHFSGTVLLHTYLTDLVLSLRRFDILERMLMTCRRLRPQARLGFHTNMAAEALRAVPLLGDLLDEVSVLTSPRALEIFELFGAMRQADRAHKLRLTAEVGLAPEIVHRVAFDTPESWTHGADALLIGSGADALLAEQHRERLEQEWFKVFPGLSLPEGVI